jgi:3-oxoacyl-[acyl-carrier protein] reductase
MKLSEQVILVTGGASGIGRYLVQDLCTEVRELLVLDKNAAALADLSESLPAVKCYECDVTSAVEVDKTIDAMRAGGARAVTVLINNAGIIHSEPLISLLRSGDRRHSAENWHKTIDANLNSVFYMSAAIVARMVEGRTKGLLVNISSIAANGNRGQSAYAATKAAVNALTVTWSVELGPFGIRSAAIAPGFIDCPSTRRALSDEHVERWTKLTPLGRLGRLEEVAKAVRFIVENDFYNGRVLELDGGLRI